MNTVDHKAPQPKNTPPTVKDPMDKALADTFPASDPVPLKPPKRGAPSENRKEIPKVRISEDAMPAEKPA